MQGCARDICRKCSPNYLHKIKTYKKAKLIQLGKIDGEARVIAKKLNIDDRVESMAMRDAFITLKDH